MKLLLLRYEEYHFRALKSENVPAAQGSQVVALTIVLIVPSGHREQVPLLIKEPMLQNKVGCDDGREVGCIDGLVVGCDDGRELGCDDGRLEGCLLGWPVGLEKGCEDGCEDGCDDGCIDGCIDG